MIRGIKFACIPTRDQDRALKFYTEKLGFRVMTDKPSERSAGSNSASPAPNRRSFFLRRRVRKTVSAGFDPLTFWTDDVFATAQALKSKGVEFTSDPKKEGFGGQLDLQRPRRQSVRALEQNKGEPEERWGGRIPSAVLSGPLYHPLYQERGSAFGGRRLRACRRLNSSPLPAYSSGGGSFRSPLRTQSHSALMHYSR